MFYFNMEPRRKLNKNVLARVICGGSSGLNFFKIIQHGIISEIVLAAKTIIFHFRRGSMLNKTLKCFKIILF